MTSVKQLIYTAGFCRDIWVFAIPIAYLAFLFSSPPASLTQQKAPNSKRVKGFLLLARQKGFEPLTYGLEGKDIRALQPLILQ